MEFQAGPRQVSRWYPGESMAMVAIGCTPKKRSGLSRCSSITRSACSGVAIPTTRGQMATKDSTRFSGSSIDQMS